MKRISFLLLALAALSVGAWAQPDTLWTRTVRLDGGSNFANDIEPDPTGGFALTGRWLAAEDTLEGFLDLFVMKVDDEGVPLWHQTFGGQFDEEGTSLCRTADGGWLAAGWSNSNGTDTDGGNYYLVRVSATGERMWEREYDVGDLDWAAAVEPLPDGGFILTGPGGYRAGSDPCLTMMRLDADGDSLWTRRYSAAFPRAGFCVKPTADGGFILAGVAQPDADHSVNIIAIKTDAEGGLEWERNYGSSRAEIVHQVVQTADGGFAVAGAVHMSVAQDYDYMLLRLSADGDSLWTGLYGLPGANRDECYSVLPTEDGGFVLGGSTFYYAPPRHQNFMLVKVSETGEEEWNALGYTPQVSPAYGLCRADNGDYLLCGATSDPMRSVVASILLMRFGLPNTVAPFGAALPCAAGLGQNYPNPFNPETEIAFDLPEQTEITLAVYDLQGRRVATLAQGVHEAGHHTAHFDGRGLSSGTYFYKLESQGLTLTRRMTLLK